MGRKVDFKSKDKKGPGRKARKQKDPPSFQIKDPNFISRRAQKRLRVQEDHKVSVEDLDLKTKKSKKLELFSDENINWLKPKLKSSSLNNCEDSDSSEDMLANEKDSDSNEHLLEDEELLEFEKAAEKMTTKQAELEKLAEEELLSNVTHTETVLLPTGQEIQKENLLPPDVLLISQRIKDIIYALADFKSRREEGRSRAEYTENLKSYLCQYYDYNEYFMEKLLELFSPVELLDFLEASELKRPVTIRSNTLKTRQGDLAKELIGRGVNLDPIGKFSKVGLVIYESQIPIGASPEYLAGHYILQGAASLLPVMALAPQVNERILDMCAAPGGKTTHIASLMKNSGVVVANDVSKERVKALVGNLHRLGITNAIVSTQDGRKFEKTLSGFDRVLLDAPCSGSGVISKDQQVKTNKSQKDIIRCQHLQKELLLAAIDCVKTGGIVVYSTCSIFPDENEHVINYALQKRPIKLLQTGIDLGKNGLTKYRGQIFHPSLSLAKRIYPHVNNMDGFFFCKLRKLSHIITPSSL